MMNYILNKISDMLDAQELKYFCDAENGVVGAGFKDSNMLFEVEKNIVEFRLIFKTAVQTDKKAAVQDYLNRVNCILKEGHFEMDDKGNVQFRICTDVSEEMDISDLRLFLMMAKASGAEKDFRENMYKVSDGEMEAKEAFQNAMRAAIKE